MQQAVRRLVERFDRRFAGYPPYGRRLPSRHGAFVVTFMPLAFAKVLLP